MKDEFHLSAEHVQTRERSRQRETPIRSKQFSFPVEINFPFRIPVREMALPAGNDASKYHQGASFEYLMMKNKRKIV